MGQKSQEEPSQGAVRRSQKDRGEDQDGVKGVEDKGIGGEEVGDLKSKANGRTMCMDRSSEGVVLKSVQVSQPGAEPKELADSDPRIACDSTRKSGGVAVL